MTTRQTKAQLAVQLAESQNSLGQHAESLTLLMERFAELELALEDTGWMRVSATYDREFSREGLRKLITLARLSFLKNPLINHAVMVQTHYVWGQGVNITAVDESVNEVIQAFLKDKRNRKELTGHQARIEKEIELQVTSNIFLVLFSNMSSGTVQVRSIPIDEIVDIIQNPEDRRDVWFYKRVWSQQDFDSTTGDAKVTPMSAYYPDYMYDPGTSKPTMIGKIPVKWDSPVYHIKTGGFQDMKFGVPEIYSALDWARAVKEDLEDYATIRRALARFAWRITVAGGQKTIAASKTRLGTTLAAGGTFPETNPSPTVGSTFIQQQGGGNLEPIKTAGSAPSPEEGRRMWLMVSAGTGIPETILSGDANVGNYATSRTLDRPTELQMRTRQTLWSDVYLDILEYVLRKSKVSANGLLTNLQLLPQVTSEAALREAALGDQATNAGDPTESIHVDFPAILEHDPLPRVQAVVQAATLNGQQSAGTMTDRTMVRLLLSALGVDNADQIIGELFQGNETMLPERIGAANAQPASGNLLPTGQETPSDAGPQGISTDESLHNGLTRMTAGVHR